jgi:hypothetical protein
VIASAIVPTLIAQKWFQPSFEPIEPQPEIRTGEEPQNV